VTCERPTRQLDCNNWQLPIRRQTSWWIWGRRSRRPHHAGAVGLTLSHTASGHNQRSLADLHSLRIWPSAFSPGWLHKANFQHTQKSRRTTINHHKGKEAASCYSISRTVTDQLFFLSFSPGHHAKMSSFESVVRTPQLPSTHAPRKPRERRPLQVRDAIMGDSDGNDGRLGSGAAGRGTLRVGISRMLTAMRDRS
jgi:hypothetical protein